MWLSSSGVVVGSSVVGLSVAVVGLGVVGLSVVGSSVVGLSVVDVGGGLHAQTVCCMLPPTCAHHSASRSADQPQSRRGCGPVSAQSQRGPGADVNNSVTLCVGRAMIAYVCVGTCRGLHALSCMPVHACP